MPKLKIIKPLPPTTEEIEIFKAKAKKELAKLENFDDSGIVYDEDCPKLTDSQLAKMKRVHIGRNGLNLAVS